MKQLPAHLEDHAYARQAISPDLESLCRDEKGHVNYGSHGLRSRPCGVYSRGMLALGKRRFHVDGVLAEVYPKDYCKEETSSAHLETRSYSVPNLPKRK